jgi:hypothetical protein
VKQNLRQLSLRGWYLALAQQKGETQSAFTQSKEILQTKFFLSNRRRNLITNTVHTKTTYMNMLFMRFVLYYFDCHLHIIATFIE